MRNSAAGEEMSNYWQLTQSDYTFLFISRKDERRFLHLNGSKFTTRNKSLRGGEYHCFISYAATIILCKGEHFKRSLLNFHSEVGNLDRCGFGAISPPRLIGCGIGLELKKSPCPDLRSLDCNKRNINSKFMRSTYKRKVRMLSIEKLMSIQTAKNYFIWKES